MDLSYRIILPVLLLAATARAQQPSAQDRAQRAFEQATSEQNAFRKEALLKESTESFKTFAAYYALGNLQLEQRRFPAARESLQNARALVDADPRPLAAADFKLGLVCEGEGQILEAIAFLESSLQRVEADRLVTQELKRMRLAAASRTQSAAAIARALATGKAIGTGPKVNLQVNFEFNRADLAPNGKTQSEELGKLLEQLNQPGNQMVFVGHTDETGTDEYNLTLSRARADSVKRYLVERYSLASTQIRTEGHGRSEPLYKGVSDENNRLNRRVEVKLVPAN